MARAAPDHVVTRTADQAVVATASGEEVIARPAADDVVATPPDEQVCARGAPHPVDTVAADAHPQDELGGRRLVGRPEHEPAVGALVEAADADLPYAAA